jgi:hypothetical protein
MFSKIESYRLVDIDGIFLSNAGDELQIVEPAGFRSLLNTLQRDEEYFGITAEFGEGESILRFSWVKLAGQTQSGHQMLRDIIDSTGGDANVKFRFYRNGSIAYEWDLLFWRPYNEGDAYFECRVKRSDFGEKLRTRFDIPINAETANDLDGGTVGSLTLEELPLHSKRIEKAAEETGQNEITENTKPQQASDEFFITPATPLNVQNNLLGYIYQIPQIVNNDFDVVPNGFYRCEILERGEYTFTTDLDFTWSFDGGGGEYRLSLTAFYRVYDTNNELKVDETLFFDEVNAGDTPDRVSSITYSDTLNFSDTRTLEVGDRVYFYFRFAYLGVGGTSGNDIAQDMTTNSGGWRLEGLTQTPPTTTKGHFGFELLDNLIKKAVGIENIPFTQQRLSVYLFSGGETITGQTSGAVGEILDVDDNFITVDVTSGSFSVGENIVSGNVIRTIEVANEVALTILIGTTGTTNPGDTITGLTSGATGTLQEVLPNGILILSAVTGTFLAGENVTDGDDYTALVGFVGTSLQLYDFAVSDSLTGNISGSAATIDSVISASTFITNLTAAGFIVNETITNGTYTFKISAIESGSQGSIIQSSLLEKEEQGATADSCQSLNFFTTGIKIRQKPKNLITTIKKIIDFYKARYNAGFMVVNDLGTKKVVIENSEYFFADKKIATYTNLVNPPKRSHNLKYLSNEWEIGYEKYGKDNEQGTAQGFATKRTYLTPITKEKKKYSVLSPVIADDTEIERLRRLQLQPDEGDGNDDELFVIKCQRHNSSNPISSADIVFDGDAATVFAAAFEFNGLYLKGQIEDATTLTIQNASNAAINGTYTIDSIVYNQERNFTFIRITGSTPGLTTLSSYELYFDVDVFLPERAQPFSGVTEYPDEKTAYNLDHIPENILFEWFHLLGSTMKQKPGSDKVRYQNGINKTDYGLTYSSSECSFTTNSIPGQTDFQLSTLRAYNEPYIRPWQWEIEVYLSFDQYTKLRNSMLGEDGSTDFGYIEFNDSFSNLVKIFPESVKYNVITEKAEIVGYEKEVPTPPGTNFKLREDGSFLLREDGSKFIREF